MHPKIDCLRCGAALPVATDPALLVATCRYCGAEQPAPDIEERRRALRKRARDDEQRRFAEEIQQEALAHQRKAGRTVTWMALPGIVIGLVAVGAAVASVLRGSFGSPLASTWDGEAPLACAGNDVIRISRAAVSRGGTAIFARENCRLTLEDCQITSDTAIEASGNARVVIQGGTIRGAVDARENATVENRGGAVSGLVRRLHNARVIGIP